MSSPVSVVIVGAGNRGTVYATYVKNHPTEGKVIAVCEPRPFHLTKMSEEHQVPAQNQYLDWKVLVAQETRSKAKAEEAGVPASEWKRLADSVVIAVLDGEHAECAVAFADLGYDILCEKPMATSISDCLTIVEAVKRNNVIFGVGHVLRYSPYNVEVAKVIKSGVLGQIINIQHMEPVGREHFAHSFVRGNWRNEEETTFSLMAKSCHDLDIINFYLNDSLEPRALSSFGDLTHFKAENKPKEAGDAKYCVECPVESTCPYSAKKIYLDPLTPGGQRGLNDHQGWATRVVNAVPDIENVADAISPKPKGSASSKSLGVNGEGHWGKCVYDGYANDVNDQQVVNIQFEGGVTAGFTMIAQTLAICARQTRIAGSHGELIGDMHTFTVTDFRTNETKRFYPDTSDDTRGSHGGGDNGLMRKFVKAVKEQDQLVLGVTPDHILRSHLMVFAAEKSRKTDENVKYKDFERFVYAQSLHE